MANYIQANLRRSGAAYDLLQAVAEEERIDILIISEPLRTRKLPRSTTDYWGTAVLQITNPTLRETGPASSGRGFARKVMDGTAVYSCYYSPSLETREFEDALHESKDDVRQWGGGAVIIAEDFNSKEATWSGGPRDRRGTILADAMEALGLVHVNEPEVTTSHRQDSRSRGGASESVLDLTFVSPSLMGRMTSWEVMDTETLSDHQHIHFRFRTDGQRVPTRTPQTIGWQVRKLEEYANMSIRTPGTCLAALPRLPHGYGAEIRAASALAD